MINSPHSTNLTMFIQKIANERQIIDNCCKMLIYFLCTFAKEMGARLLAHCNAQGVVDDNFILYKNTLDDISKHIQGVYKTDFCQIEHL